MSQVQEKVQVSRKVTLETPGLRANKRADGGYRISDKRGIPYSKMGEVDIDLKDAKQLRELIEILNALEKKQ